MANTDGPRQVVRLILGLCVMFNVSVITMVHLQSRRTVGDFDVVVSALLYSVKAPSTISEANKGSQGDQTTQLARNTTEASVENDDKKKPDTKSVDDTKSTGRDDTCEKRVLNSDDSMLREEFDYFLKSTPKDDDQDCSRYNSEAWLKGPRFGNAHDPLMTADFVRRLILDVPSILNESSTSSSSSRSRSQTLLGTSLCFEQSRFLRDTETSIDKKSIRLWAVRLTYLAIHYHQHRLAIPEVAARYSSQTKCSQDLLTKQHDVGSFDFECGAGAKYLVTPLSGNGLGANVRGGVVPALIAGLQTNRIVVFVNNSPVGDRYMKSTWPLVTCDRKDYQCFFMPTTPCTLTHEDLKNGMVLSKPHMRKFVNRGVLPPEAQQAKVLSFYPAFQPKLSVPMEARKRLSQYAHAMLDTLPCDDPRLPAMRQGADLILVDDDVRPGYNYAAAAEKTQHALAFYFLRPKMENTRKIDSILSEIIPKDLDEERSVGLPIRASDKCKGESECLSFDQHMQAVNASWAKHELANGVSSQDISVVFTTESKAMVQEQKDFASNTTLRSRYPLSFNFVTNTKDVTPDTGFIKEVDKSTAEDSMLSSITSFKAQLLPRASIGNCCSNFHALLNDFLMEGCGAASDNTFLCLQEYEDDPLIRVCCGWHHDCKQAKQKYIEELKAKQ